MSNSNERSTSESDEDEILCPLCDTPITYVHLNYRKVMRMCRNADCEFPFGNMDIQAVIDEILRSFEARAPHVKASTASWSRVHVHKSIKNVPKGIIIKKRSKKRKYNYNDIINDLEKSLRSLDNMTIKLEEWAKGEKKPREETDQHTNIVNNEERRECMNLPGPSGIKLVKKVETGQLKPDTSVCGGKLEIDKDTNRNKSTNVGSLINSKDENSEDGPRLN